MGKMASYLTRGLLPLAAVLQIVMSEVTVSCDARVSGCGDGTFTANGASIYVRWGSNTCPEGAELVYSGEVGGGQFGKSGSAANVLCLPLESSYPQHTNDTVHVAEIYHVEYSILPDSRDDRHVVCAVCRAARATTVMIPGSVRCPSLQGWRTEYSGYLMAGLPWDNRHSMQYVCVDSSLGGERRESADGGRYGVLYHTRTKCHRALPCDHFQERVTGCVVCSK